MTRSMIVTDYGEHDVSPKFEVLLAYAPKNRFGHVDGRSRAAKILRRYERMVCSKHKREWEEGK